MSMKKTNNPNFMKDTKHNLLVNVNIDNKMRIIRAQRQLMREQRAKEISQEQRIVHLEATLGELVSHLKMLGIQAND